MKTRHFIIIDDDPLNNFICKTTISLLVESAIFETFLSAEEGLEYLNTTFREQDHDSFLILDLNMPILTGWGFLEEFKKMEEAIQRRISIYIVTSSVDLNDQQKLLRYNMVKGFICKPLTLEKVEHYFIK